MCDNEHTVAYSELDGTVECTRKKSCGGRVGASGPDPFFPHRPYHGKVQLKEGVGA